jgi:hypothetical protein
MSTAPEARPIPAGFSRLSMIAATIVAVGVIAGCASSGAVRAPGSSTKLNLTTAQLQIKVRALADPFSGIIEETVWELCKTTDDPAEHRLLLIWQINLINSIQRAAFQPNPVAAFFDTWALVEQFREYVVSGARPSFTDEQRAITLEAIDRMEAALFVIAVEAADENAAAAVQAQIKDWAAAHPVNRFAVRDSPQSEMAEWSARADLGALASVKHLGATLDDVMARLDLYSEYVPKQASWHAQAVAYDWLDPNDAQSLFADLTTTATAFDRIASTVEDLPALVADERRVVLDTVALERELVLEELLTTVSELKVFIQDQRIDFVEHQLRTERDAVFEAIAAERAIIIAEARAERKDTMTELDQILDGLVERSAIKVVDHFFMRALQLVAILLVGLALIAIVVVAVWKRK